jgi:hypothetical protein
VKTPALLEQEAPNLAEVGYCNRQDRDVYDAAKALCEGD